MRRTLGFLAVALFAGRAQAYEYLLQFTPPGNYQDLVVAGYAIAGKTIVGNCSYTAITAGSGRDPGSHHTPVPQTCTWSLTGVLLSTVSGAPAVPAPVATVGTETIYARKSRALYTGVDSAFGPFVFTFGAHYTWTTSEAFVVLPQQPYSFTVTLASDGDVPLVLHGLRASTSIAATPDTPATRVRVTASTCQGVIAPGAGCQVALAYTDAGLTSPTGLAYDVFTLHLAANALAAPDFVQEFIDEVPVPADGGG